MAKTIKAEMWDKMQFLFRNYYDRMIHAVLHFDKPLDIDILKQVLLFTTEKVPVLHSRFVTNPIEPYWEVQQYSMCDILTVKDSTNLDEDINTFIYQSIPVESNVQYRVGVFNKDGHSSFAMIVNHMCFDGGDFKYFLKKLAENYNKLLNNEKDLNIKSGTREWKSVYTKLSAEDTEVAKSLYKNISAVKDEHKFPLTAPSENDKTMICRRKISAELFTKFRMTGKAFDVTVNDLMLAVYINALYQIGGYRKSDSLSIPCMVDLRRHIAGGENAGGLTNHTGFMVCSVTECGETINDTLIEVLRSVKKSKKDKFMGLYSLPLLNLAYKIFPHAISETAIKIGYLNPLIGMSNIGVLDPAKLSFGDATLVDGFMTGAVKFKPYMQL
ncbi:MAG: condensation domain-containing protein, partial [Clostridia bacterium]